MKEQVHKDFSQADLEEIREKIMQAVLFLSHEERVELLAAIKGGNYAT